MNRQFEKEVFLKAPVERVWQALTTPEQMSVWLGGQRVVQFDPHVGGTIQLEGLFPGEIAIFEPPHRLGWKWDPENGTEPGEETLTLSPENGGTRLHVLSISKGRWADRPMYFGGSVAGWLDWLESLESYLYTGKSNLFYGSGQLGAVVDAEETPDHVRLFFKKVAAGGAAEQAGVQAGDTLVAYNGHAMDRPASFWRQAWRGEPGDRVALELERNGQSIHADVILQAPARKQA